MEVDIGDTQEVVRAHDLTHQMTTTPPDIETAEIAKAATTTTVPQIAAEMSVSQLAILALHAILKKALHAGIGIEISIDNQVGEIRNMTRWHRTPTSKTGIPTAAKEMTLMELEVSQTSKAMQMRCSGMVFNGYNGRDRSIHSKNT
jgi:hypothetical protein